jgi:hypothetical protein
VSRSKLRQLKGDHDYSFSDDFSKASKVITQTAFYKAGDVVIAIGELNRPNHWNDPAFDKACAFLQQAWNEAVAKAKDTQTPSSVLSGDDK